MSFVVASLAALLVLPALAAALRRSLPAARRQSATLAPVAFGRSPRARPSPRHAVLLHRGLVGSFVLTLVGLAILPAAAAFRDAGPALLPGLFGLVLPILVVTLHARRRSSGE